MDILGYILGYLLSVTVVTNVRQGAFRVWRYCGNSSKTRVDKNRFFGSKIVFKAVFLLKTLCEGYLEGSYRKTWERAAFIRSAGTDKKCKFLTFIDPLVGISRRHVTFSRGSPSPEEVQKRDFFFKIDAFNLQNIAQSTRNCVLFSIRASKVISKSPILQLLDRKCRRKWAIPLNAPYTWKFVISIGRLALCISQNFRF